MAKLYKDKKEILEILSKHYTESKCLPVLIGSRAMNHYISKRSVYSDTDYDFIVPVSYALQMINIETFNYLHLKEWPNHLKVMLRSDKLSIELEVALPGLSSQDLLDLCQDEKIQKMKIAGGYTIQYVIPPLLYLERIKTSHIYQPINWFKHVKDLHMMRQALLPKVKTSENWYRVYAKDKPTHLPTTKNLILEMLDLEDQFMIKRRREFNKLFGIPGEGIHLDMANKEFLDPEELKMDVFIDHDELHDLIKYDEVPIQNLIRKDLSNAMCDLSLFQSLTKDQQLKCVCEERDVLALERRLLPKIMKEAREAREYAMYRICTTITKGWFRGFAVDHYPEVMELTQPLQPFIHKILKTEVDYNDTEERWRCAYCGDSYNCTEYVRGCSYCYRDVDTQTIKYKEEPVDLCKRCGNSKLGDTYERCYCRGDSYSDDSY